MCIYDFNFWRTSKTRQKNLVTDNYTTQPMLAEQEINNLLKQCLFLLIHQVNRTNLLFTIHSLMMYSFTLNLNSNLILEKIPNLEKSKAILSQRDIFSQIKQFLLRLYYSCYSDFLYICQSLSAKIIVLELLTLIADFCPPVCCLLQSSDHI